MYQADRSKAIREAVKVAFPGVKFSVRLSAGGGAVNIRWQDGPTPKQVATVANQWESVRYDEHSGEILSGGNFFVFTDRKLSPEKEAELLETLRSMYAVREFGGFAPWQWENAEKRLLYSAKPRHELTFEEYCEHLSNEAHDADAARFGIAPTGRWLDGDDLRRVYDALVAEAAAAVSVAPPPVADDSPAPKVNSGAFWRVNLEHDGVEVSFPSKPAQEIIDQLKAHGFRWSGFSKVWYAKDNTYRRDFLRTIADEEAPTGEKVSFAEKMERQAERLEARQERLEERAEKHQQAADSRFGAARKLGEAIPFGQPILVGHHSEGRHRRDIERIDSNIREGFEEQKEAERLSNAAAASESHQNYLQRPDVTLRRIKRLEADIRACKRNGRPNRAAALQEQVDYWAQRLEQAGHTVYGPQNVKVGDRVDTRFGLATVRKVNPQTVTIDYDAASLGVLGKGAKVGYDRIKSVSRSLAGVTC